MGYRTGAMGYGHPWHYTCVPWGFGGGFGALLETALFYGTTRSTKLRSSAQQVQMCVGSISRSLSIRAILLAWPPSSRNATSTLRWFGVFRLSSLRRRHARQRAAGRAGSRARCRMLGNFTTLDPLVRSKPRGFSSFCSWIRLEVVTKKTALRCCCCRGADHARKKRRRPPP